MSETAIQQQDDHSYLIRGELNMQTVPDMLKQAEPILADGREELVFDLQGISRTDSAGLALLVEWMQAAGQQQTRITFRNLPTQLRDIARVSGLEELLPLA